VQSRATPDGKKLIDEINAAKVKARNLTFEAERKRKEAGANKAEHDRLIEEAAKLYGQTSDMLGWCLSLSFFSVQPLCPLCLCGEGWPAIT